jgi:hypothetical protein
MNGASGVILAKIRDFLPAAHWQDAAVSKTETE